MQEKNLINVMVGKNQQRWRNSVVSGVAQYCIRKLKNHTRSQRHQQAGVIHAS